MIHSIILSYKALLNKLHSIIIIFMCTSLIFTINSVAQSPKTTTIKNKSTHKSLRGSQADHESMVLPRYTEQQRDSINKPIEGMVIFNKTTKNPQFYDGIKWRNFDYIHHTIGEQFAGGIVFYIDSQGEHGLVVAPFDQSKASAWGAFETPVGASDKAIGTGQSNTQKIVKAKSSTGNSAALLCSSLNLNGYNDWFLPSIDELNLIYKNLKLKGLAELNGENYWASSETDFNNAWLQNFKTGMPIEQNTNKIACVRAIRSF